MDQIIRAEVRFQGRRAGELAKLGREGFRFQYVTEYLANPTSLPIAQNLPLRFEPYFSPVLFAFFTGLLTEGCLRKVQSETQKIDERDSFSLLLNNGEDLAGAVTVLPLRESS